MEARELRDDTIEELRDRERELSEQLFALRLQDTIGQLESPARMRQVRRDRARVLTVINEKERAAAAAAANEG